MEELLSVLCVLSIVLPVIAVVGHGIWLLAAPVFRFFFGSYRPTERLDLLERNRIEIAGFRRRLDAWRERGWIDVDQYQAMQALIDREARGAHAEPVPAVMAATNAPAEPKIEINPIAAQPVSDPEVFVADVVDSPFAIAGPQVMAAFPEASPLHAPPSPPPFPPPSAPATPSRTLADMLQAFMEAKNIRWVELISGVLIVVSAVGLVISLRATLKDKIPYFPALSFLLVTASIHAAGIYSLRRWNLKTTSRGVLIIGTLLVPLSVLASILLSGEGRERSSGLIFAIAVVVGFASFGAMNYFATRALVRHDWWRIMTAVLGTSLGQVVVHRWQPGLSAPLSATLLLAIPVAAFLVANLGLLVHASRRFQIGKRPAHQFFLELGVSLFALAAPLGLFLSKMGAVPFALENASPILSLVAATVLAAGLVGQRRMTVASYRMAATSLALLGGGAMLLMVAFAWPQLPLLVAVGSLNFLLLTGMAIYGGLALLHVFAIGCLGLAILSGVHLSRGIAAQAEMTMNRHLVQVMASGLSGLVLTIYGFAVASAGLILVRKNRTCREHGSSYLVGAAGVAGLSIAIALYAGYLRPASSDRDLASPILLVHAIVVVAASRLLVARQRFRLVRLPPLPSNFVPGLAGFGSALLLAGMVHALYLNEWLRIQLLSRNALPSRPVLLGFLSHSLMSTVIVLGSAAAIVLRTRSQPLIGQRRRAGRIIQGFIRPLSLAAVVTSIAATPFALYVSADRFAVHAIYVIVASSAWLSFSILTSSRVPLVVFQILATISLIYATTAQCMRASWWTGELLSETHLQIQFAVLAIWCGCWSLARKFVGETVAAIRLSSITGTENRVAPAWVDASRTSKSQHGAMAATGFARTYFFDELLLGVLTLGIVGLALFRSGPGIVMELGLRRSVLAALTPANSTLVTAAWFAVGFVIVALVVALWERLSVRTLQFLVFASFAIPLRITDRFVDQVAVGSSLRWLCAGMVGAWAIPAWWLGGKRELKWRWLDQAGAFQGPAEAMRFVSLFAGGTTILLLTTAALATAGGGNVPGGPIAGTFFARVGTNVSFAVPLSVLVAVLFGYGIREASQRYFLAASATFQYALSLGCLIPILSAGRAIDAMAVASLLQWNLIGLGAFTCAWTAARRWIQPVETRSVEALDLIQIQIAVLLAAFLAFALWTGSNLIFEPQLHQNLASVLGNWPSYVGLGLAVVSGFWLAREFPRIWQVHVAALAGLVAIHLVATSAHASDQANQWRGFHVYSGGQILFAVAAAAGCLYLSFRSRAAVGVREGAVSSEGDWSIWWPEARLPLMIWSTVATVISLFAAFRGASSDPLKPVWSTQIAIWGMIAMALIALSDRRYRFAYFSTAIAGLATFLFWIGLSAGQPLRNEWGFVTLQIASICFAAIGWLIVDVYCQRRGQRGLNDKRSALAVHRFVAVAATVVTGLYFVLGSIAVPLAHRPISLNFAQQASFITAIGSILLLHVGSMWDRRIKSALFGIYLLSLAIVVYGVERYAVGHAQRGVALITAFSVLVAISGWLWSWSPRLAILGYRLGIPEPAEGLRRTAQWFPGMTIAFSVLLSAAGFAIVQGSELRQHRMAAAMVPFLLAAAIVGIAQQHRRDHMQQFSLYLAALGCVFLGWADIEPGWSDRVLLLRATRTLIALCGLAFVYGVIAVRVFSDASGWRLSARRAAIAIGATAIISLLGVLFLEVVTFEPGIGAPIDAIQIAAVSIVLVGLVVALLSLAVLPGRDPLAMTERGRMIYVYAAQIVAGLLFAHIYLAKPELFAGTLRHYWPYIVVAIAFAGVGVSEVFQRLGWNVLAEPFQRSGAFLALVPALGMWIANSRSDYSLVLAVIGILYMALAFSQKSMIAGGIAAVAGNGALWSLLRGTEDLTFRNHPQFWLIPPALSVLVASQIHRNRLTPAQLAAIRYVAVGVIYLSSFVEMLKIGIGESLWPPVILITLAVIGVFVGIAMQIRAYLYLGSIFILVAMISMVAHAAQSIDHVWPWWAFGIALGVSIMVLFGWFEGHREQMGGLVRRLRQWEK